MFSVFNEILKHLVIFSQLQFFSFTILKFETLFKEFEFNFTRTIDLYTYYEQYYKNCLIIVTCRLDNFLSFFFTFCFGLTSQFPNCVILPSHHHHTVRSHPCPLPLRATPPPSTTTTTCDLTPTLQHYDAKVAEAIDLATKVTKHATPPPSSLCTSLCQRPPYANQIYASSPLTSHDLCYVFLFLCVRILGEERINLERERDENQVDLMKIGFC